MLAGLLIAALLVAGMAFAVPWISEQRPSPDDLADEPTERFSESMRILDHDGRDHDDPAAVSTPPTRAAEFRALRLTARQAAARRRTVLLVLLAAAVISGVLGGASLIAWWSFLVPTALAVGFIGVARVTVVRMHRTLDARAAELDAGFADHEDTEVIEVVDEETQSTEFSVDLSAPTDLGAFWDPVPVTAPTYVQQPLTPRTVRTIDLSAPVAPERPLVPTADHPDEVLAEDSVALPRAIGE